ncbi:MAG TPA: hypothetical protein VJ949_14130 [Cryomorphaceae bacterium]|nr:hypothetical protein [Cryomorphaceae bacterium]
MLKKNFFLFILLSVAIVSCKEDDEPPTQIDPTPPISALPVNVDLDSLPYQTLEEYNFFIGDEISDLTPNEGLLLYEPITQLFTDYAKKSRYIWMPEGVSANYVSDFESFDFPDGSILIKNFFYENVLPTNERRVMETRLMFKRDGVWEFADYVWNDEQTEAVYDLGGQNKPIDVVLDNGQTLSINYRIPSESQCITCHKINETPSPNGPKPQNLNADLEYQDGIMNQLMKWAEMGYLEPTYPSEIETVVDWEDESQLLQDRVRAYLDANCGHCHKQDAHCSYRNIRLSFEDNDRENNLGICVPFDEFVPGQPAMDYIIESGDANKSMLIYRMLSEEENIQMPLIGKSVVHQEGLDLLTTYINSLEETCN